MQVLKERTGSGGVRDSCRECGEGKEKQRNSHSCKAQRTV